MIIEEKYKLFDDVIKNIAQKPNAIKTAQCFKQDIIKKTFDETKVFDISEFLFLTDYQKIVLNPIIPKDKKETKQLKLSNKKPQYRILNAT